MIHCAIPYPFMKHAKTLALTLALGLSASAASAQVEICEENGLLVLEVESQAPAGNWVEETQYAGFAGTSYFRWAGGNQFNNPGLGTLTYKIHITTPGDYQMRIHNHHNDPDTTMENDCWTRMDGGTWVKTYSGQYLWNWASRFEYADNSKEPAHFQLSAGSHTFQMSGRSQNFRIDRVHFYLGGSPSTSQPASPTGGCAGPTTHPDLNPTAITAVFADGTFGPLEARSGTPITLPNPVRQIGRHLSMTDSTRMLLPNLTYTDQELLLRIRSGMPEASWVGMVIRAADENDEFSTPGGTQSMVFLQKQAGTGRVRVSIHDGTDTVFSGPYFPLGILDSSSRGTNMRVSIAGDTVQCTLNGYDALNGGYTGIANPALGGYTSIRSNISASFPGEIGIDYFLAREAGSIPDLYFDASGKLWLSALEKDLLIIPTWEAETFVFRHATFTLGLAGFLSGVFPYMDSRDSDPDHFVIGIIDSGLALTKGSTNVFEYKGQREGDYQP